MTAQAQIVMLLWLPIVFIIFRSFPLQKAIVVSFIGAWLFLPQRAGFAVSGLPDYSRMTATCIGIFLATLMTGPQPIAKQKIEWLDIPMIIWCISPFFSSISNNRTIYDGLAQTLEQSITFGIPYFLGRRYLGNLVGLRQLGVGMFVGGLIYVPLCLFESRMSPQLHRMIYGYHGNPNWQVHRLGGYRPVVFMQHGLSVGMWMMAATLVGIWLWQSGVIKKLWGIPMNFLVFFLLITFVLIRSTGAYFYLIGGLIILVTAKKFRTGLALSILILVMSFYLLLAATGNFTGKRAESILSAMRQVVPADRVESLEFRWWNEELLVQKALEKPIFGWGGYGDNRVYNEEGNPMIFRFYDPRVLPNFLPTCNDGELKHFFGTVDTYFAENVKSETLQMFNLTSGALKKSELK